MSAEASFYTLKRDHAAADRDDGDVDGDDTPRQPLAQSLTVRFNEGTETWRSPPTYYGGDDFVWPPGWIEVQRRSSAAVSPSSSSSSVNEQQQETASTLPRSEVPRPEVPRPPHQTWIREFHPPRRSGKGGGKSPKICHSIDEVKRYIERQKVKQLKQERFTASRDESMSRRVGRSRNINTSQKGTTTSSNIIDLTVGSQEGTQTELNKIMKANNQLSERMRKSILYGAVLARKKNLLESAIGFMGANGRMYPDLRKAFGKHVDMKQCSLCKSRVQGHWYCRITHAHLDKPDYDGGDSAACLRELYRCSVEEMEENLWNLFPTKGGRRKRARVTPPGFESTNWSMNVLSEDILFQIASFLPSLPQLVSFCKTSQRSQQLLYRSVHSEKLFRGVFLCTFGEHGTRGKFERNLSWRERWCMIRDLRRGLVKKRIRPTTSAVTASANISLLRETVGVLLPQEEREAIYYDNPDYGDPERANCNGYFAMEMLHLPTPPNARPGWKPPVVLRGDFNGLRIFESESLFRQNLQNEGDNGGEQNRFYSVGHDEGGGQVLSLIHCDLEHTSLEHKGQGEECPAVPPCCFIGFAFGGVSAVTATLTPEGDCYRIAISGRHHAHDSEVTALSFVNCSSAPGEDTPVLFSACCEGKVYFYPHALDPTHNFSLEESVLAFSNYYNCPIFSMASTIIRSQEGKQFSVLCTGDRDGNIRIWLKADNDLMGLCTSTTVQKFRHIQLYKSSTHRGTGYHLVTRAMFLRDNLLITGTNNGDIRFWKLGQTGDPSRPIGGRDPLPNLTLRYDLIGIHNGAVELLMIVGDILLSSGGNDGKIVGWDISTGLRLGSVRCHPGRQIPEEEGGGTISSCVVDMLISGKDGRLISLCRDGSLRHLKLMR